VRKAAWALLLLFVLAIPWEYSLDLGAPFGNIARIVGLLVLFIAVPAVLRDGRLRRPGPLVWMTVALYAWLCCSYFWTLVPHDTLVKLRGYPQEMMLVWLVWEFAETPDDLRNLLRAWLAGSWVLALLTLGSFFWPDTAALDQIRFVAAGQDPNDSARSLDFGFPIAAILLDDKDNWFARILAVGYLPVGLAAVLLTASRGGFVGALVALAGCGALLLTLNPKGLLGTVYALPAVAGIVWATVPSETMERLGTIAEQLRSGDLNQRVNIWRTGWQAFLHAPICGNGAGSFVAAAGVASIDTAHNTVLAMAVEGGLCAVALALAIVLTSIRSIVRTRGALRIVLGTLMAVWLVSSFVGTVQENRTTWLLFGIFALSARLTEENPESILTTFPPNKSIDSIRVEAPAR